MYPKSAKQNLLTLKAVGGVTCTVGTPFMQKKPTNFNSLYIWHKVSSKFKIKEIHYMHISDINVCTIDLQNKNFLS